MSRSQAEHVIKNIIQEIVQECSSKGQAVSETLVAFMVKAVVLDSANNFNVDRALTKDDIRKLMKICVDRITDNKSPALETIKMQVYFDMNYTTRDEFLQEHHKVLASRMTHAMREVTDSRPRNREEFESLYRKIVAAIVLKSGLGSATDITVIREATAALQSVFPQTELGTFLTFAKREKERQMDELTMIVTGIRLFNKNCSKGGESIDDLPAILNEAIPAATRSIDAELQRTLETVSKYITLVEALHSPAYLTRTAGQHMPSVELLTQAVINCRQHETFLRLLLHDVVNCAQQVESLQAQLSSRMHQLQSIVQAKTAVPTAQVYPQFMHVAQIWTSFQDEMVLLSVLSNILVNLEPFYKVQSELFPDALMQPLLDEFIVKTDEERNRHARGNLNRPTFQGPDMDWLFSETTKNFNKLPLQFHGYCPWTIVTSDRLLIPGNTDIGVLRYKELCYVFASKHAAEDFAHDPEKYIEQIAELARKSPELIQLLELHSQFAAIAPYGQSKDVTAAVEKPMIKCDNGSQTDTHFYESNIVRSYQWNEWELRRQAIKLVNLRTKMTRAVQTNLSNMRRDNIAQTFPPVDLGTQTLQDHYTNVAKPQVFMAGLRGGALLQPTVLTKVDLTLDVDHC